MNGKQLKNSILQWAIQGKLVPQNPKDEPASKLLERIAAARNGDGADKSTDGNVQWVILSGAQSAKSKNLAKKKKSAPTSRIYREGSSWYEQIGSAAPTDITDQIPFDIPETWEWTRMGNIGSWGAGATPAKGNPEFYNNGVIPWLVTGELNNSIVTETKVKVSQKALDKCSLRLCKPGDVLIAMYGATIGKLAIAGIELTTNQACCACTLHYDFNKYLFYFLMASKTDLTKRGEGGAQPNISKEKLVNYLIPLPPLAEQKRIVEKLEKVLPLVDEYDSAQIELDKLNAALPESLKKSLLQEAIQGKLVPQNPKDDPASKLLERITATRNGDSPKKKKSAPTSRIYREGSSWYEQIGTAAPTDITDQIPFDIPETWEWCRLKNIATCNLGKTLNQNTDTGSVKGYLCSINVYWEKISLIKVKTAKFEEKELEKYKLEKGDLLICEGGDIGRSCVWENDCEMYYQNALHRVRFACDLNPIFYRHVLYLYKCLGFLDEVAKGVTIKHLTQDSLNKLVFPLPPLAEQKRIVAKLEQLFKTL